MSFANDIEQRIASEVKTEVLVDKERGHVERVLSVPYELTEFFPNMVKFLLSTQRLIKKGIRLEGNRVIIPLRIGVFQGPVIPALRIFVLREVQVLGDRVKFVDEGVGGAKSFLRLLHRTAPEKEFETVRVGKDEVHRYTAYYPILHKVVIGLDDTDTSSKGDTYLTALHIGRSIEAEGYGRFVKEMITFNYPRNPFKTTNNASSAMVFHVEPSRKTALIQAVTDKAQEHSNSRETGLAVLSRLDIPPSLQSYTRQCKSRMMDVSDTEHVAKTIGAQLLSFDQDRGKIGALSSLGFVNQPGRAIAPSMKFRMMLRLGNIYVRGRDVFAGA